MPMWYQALGPIRKQHVIHHVRWFPPFEGVLKVYVDDSSFGNFGNAHFGGLLRNNMGIVFKVFWILL